MEAKINVGLELRVHALVKRAAEEDRRTLGGQVNKLLLEALAVRAKRQPDDTRDLFEGAAK